MPQSPGQHGDLTAMMSIVRDQVSKEARDIRLEALNLSVAIDGRAQRTLNGLPALFKRLHGLLL